MTKRTPTPPPRVPPLVRRGVATMAVGFGLGGSAAGCGGEVARPAPDPSPRDTTQGAADATLEESDAPAADEAEPSEGASAPESSSFVPPLPPPLPPR